MGTSALSNKTSKEMELSDEQSRLQIANERLGRATKENSKLALILQAKGEVEKSEEKIEILNKEISELEKQYNKLVEVFARSEEDLEKAKDDVILAQDELDKSQKDLDEATLEVKRCAELVKVAKQKLTKNQEMYVKAQRELSGEKRKQQMYHTAK